MVKKFALVLLLVMAFGMIASAEESSIYVRTLYVEKIYASSFGYKIEYRRTNSLFLAEAYLPLEWFGGPESKAKLVYAADNSVPFVNVFWESPEGGGDPVFTHMVLYVHPQIGHISWGNLRNDEGLAAKFDLDEPEFVY